MNFVKYIVLTLLFPLMVDAQVPGEPCLTDYVFKKNLELFPESRQKLIEIDRFTRQWISANQNRVQRREIITIPVVVHVVHHEDNENISDEQILSQIEVLNKDFRKTNIESNDLPEEFAQVAADIEIEFCLASVDPDGNEASGITRIQTSMAGIASEYGPGGKSRIKHDDLGGKSAWDTKRYLNIWVGDYSGGLLGEGCFPGNCLESEDGIVVDHSVFGTKGSAKESPNNYLGRTATHEIGHYFNLQHLWGSQMGNCTDDDEVADTPLQFFSTTGCPSHPQFSCSSADMFMNYMDYTYDACMGLFTSGQKLRMLATIEGSRSGLLTSNGCDQVLASQNILDPTSVGIFPNPANDQLYVDLKLNPATTATVFLTDMLGRQLYHLESSGKERQIIPTSSIANGVYLLRIETSEGFLNKKLVINH